jgi:hypothetical protein
MYIKPQRAVLYHELYLHSEFYLRTCLCVLPPSVLSEDAASYYYVASALEK